MEPHATTAKKAYTTPALTVHGAMRDLTRIREDQFDASCPIGS